MPCPHPAWPRCGESDVNGVLEIGSRTGRRWPFALSKPNNFTVSRPGISAQFSPDLPVLPWSSCFCWRLSPRVQYHILLFFEFTSNVRKPSVLGTRAKLLPSLPRPRYRSTMSLRKKMGVSRGYSTCTCNTAGYCYRVPRFDMIWFGFPV